MKKYWADEVRRFTGMFLAGLVLGFLSGYWLLSILIVLLLYLSWHYYQLFTLHKWIVNGLKRSKMPVLHGIWGDAAHRLFQSRLSKKQSKKKLAKMVKSFRTSTAAIPDATVILEKDTVIEWFNEAATSLLGLKKTQDRGQPIGSLVRDPLFRDYLFSEERTDDLRMTSPVNADIKLLIKIVKYGQGKILLTARDVSIEEHLDKVRRDFVSNASHELRTPLTVIRGYLELICDDAQYPQSIREKLATVLVQSDRMEHIIDDLLTLSRLENTHLSENEGDPVNVMAIFYRLSRDAEQAGLVGAGQINISGDESTRILGVVSEITSVCSNLLYNAIKHNPPGTRVELQWFQNGSGQPCILVGDDGRGIETQHLDRLTERFYRVDDSRSRDSGGTGLGLAIVKHIVQRHGGNFQISSTHGIGSSFTCCFAAARNINSSK